MKTFRGIRIVGIVLLTMVFGNLMAQQPAIQFFRPYDQRGINVFETSKEDTVVYDGFKFRIGAGFAQAYQNIKHSNSYNAADPANNPAGKQMYPLTRGTNLAMANLNFDVQLADGVRLNLVSYMSSRHHNEFWVKGGYLQIDKVGFMNSEFLNNLWKNLTLRVGHMEVNYGDAHFRRSDGGHTLQNAFIENNIMDAFSTEIGAELYWQKNGFLAMVGLTDGEIQGSTTRVDERKPSIYTKLAFDKKFSDDMRFRISGSLYTTKSSIRNTIHAGDRTGSHYYFVTENTAATLAGNFASGRFAPGLTDNITAIMINPFFKVSGFELFGTYEMASGNSAIENGEIQSTNPANPRLAKLSNRSVSQVAVDALYRFSNDKFYLGARYNTVTGTIAVGQSTTQPNLNQGVRQDITINRLAIAGGWFITRNVLMKVEYVDQQYKDYPVPSILNDARFKGFVIEGTIAF